MFKPDEDRNGHTEGRCENELLRRAREVSGDPGAGRLLASIVRRTLIGAVYGLMCVGLGLIFGVMRVINFAQGDFMMLGMYAAFYFFTALGCRPLSATPSGRSSPSCWPVQCSRCSATAVHLTLISRVSGTRSSSLEGEGHYAQLILTLGIALILQNGGLLVFGSVLASIRTPLSSSAWELGPYVRRQRLHQQGARHRRRCFAS